MIITLEGRATVITYDLKSMQICEIHEPTVVALGTFDGCHAGHMSVFNSCRALSRELGAKSAVFTFSSSPKDFFTGRTGACLFSLDEKIRAIRQSGIDFLCIEDFASIAELSATSFLNDILVGALHAIGACCGFNFKFGKGASSDAQNLRDFFENRGGCVRICDKITFEGHTVSSTFIKELIECGEIEKATAISRPYSIYAMVEHGKELGRTIGIPTINQKIPVGKVVPAKGVYITECEIGENVYPSVTNVGVRPTVDGDGGMNIETHIIGYNGYLYGSYVRVNFYKKIRDERKFPSLDALKKEVQVNIQKAIEYFK